MAADTGVGLTPAEFFHLGSGDISPLVPIQFLRWTPNYSGAGFITIPEWSSTNGEVTGEARDSSGTLVDLSTATDTTSPITQIGLNTFTGQITNLRLTDLDTPANSRFYRSVISSETMPDSQVLVDELGDGSTNGTMTDFPATQKWVPLLGTNQAYLSGRDDVGFVNGLRTSDNTMSAIDPTIGLNGSWFNNQPAIGSLLLSGDSVLQVVTTPGIHNITYAIANGTDDQIQRAFEYPNVLDVNPFDPATEAYCGNFNAVERNGTFIRGVKFITSGTFMGQISLSASTNTDPRVNGTFRADRAEAGDVITAANNASLRVVEPFLSQTGFRCERISGSGTNEEIQQGFQWPNHFTVTSP